MPYAGFANKGTYTLHAEVDPDGLIPQIFDLNNVHEKIIHVRGSPPDAPLEPNLNSAIALQRHRPFTLWTSGSDRAGDRLSGWGGYMPFLGSIDEVRLACLLPGEPLTLSIARSGDRIVMAWTQCGVLQWASDVTGPWTDVPDAAPPYIVTPTLVQVFYRLRAP